jgi:hypothetical protein
VVALFSAGSFGWWVFRAAEMFQEGTGFDLLRYVDAPCEEFGRIHVGVCDPCIGRDDSADRSIMGGHFVCQAATRQVVVAPPVTRRLRASATTSANSRSITSIDSTRSSNARTSTHSGLILAAISSSPFASGILASSRTVPMTFRTRTVYIPTGTPQINPLKGMVTRQVLLDGKSV